SCHRYIRSGPANSLDDFGGSSAEHRARLQKIPTQGRSPATPRRVCVPERVRDLRARDHAIRPECGGQKSRVYKESMKLTELSNEGLLKGLLPLVGQGRALLARLLAYLGEVEDRRLDLEAACSSLFDFCVRRLGLSEDEAFRRIAAARLARRFPVVLDMVES